MGVVYSSPLGDGSLEFTKQKPAWSTRSNNVVDDDDQDEGAPSKEKRKRLKRESWIHSNEDPAMLINKLLGKVPSSTSSSKTATTKTTTAAAEVAVVVPKKKKTIEELRKERMEREEKERARAKALVKERNAKSQLDTDTYEQINQMAPTGYNSSYLKYSGAKVKSKD
ncbi:hypothetical protein SAMD00019534_033750 [Acytostelium subglobosum LB1]|uniref:hypothetical protein n=1 Tax=Acytostelium subglobosum LB1 TaxID=1410327 RepID=UPI000644D02A|nr:hypothetical protein SAMD00019534_033750 [Acytostelium subglobosum LB1]GAM20200.1 hypothetical protein SAMD00019534_033750 [Acytostelium subglobosum LB1]|eukprot:XP_012759721.1 hypothetical protein SAMD00019534_033750 [Acytostelium subglobosum LB1]